MAHPPRTPPTSLARRLLVAAAAAAIPVAAAYATTIDANALRNAGWRLVTEAAPGHVACNYLYVDGANQLLYYGTSGDCSTRLNSHFTDMRSGHDMLEAQLGFLPEDQRDTFQLDTVAWVKQTDGHGRTANNGGADNCLGVVSTTVAPRIWWRQLPSGQVAAAVEACVLNRVMGFCNRQGGGNTRASWIAFRTALQQCGAT